MNPDQELFALADSLAKRAVAAAIAAVMAPLDALDTAANQIERSFSGSWLGYHSRVYYAGLKPVPPGAHFSQEWGTEELFGSSMGSRGDWEEFDYQQVKAYIRDRAGNPDLTEARTVAEQAEKVFNESKSDIVSILTTECDETGDPFLAKLKSEVETLRPLTPTDVAEIWAPKGQIFTRDMVALGQGNHVPPHVAVQAETVSLRHTF
jgi:hypothetical protein